MILESFISVRTEPSLLASDKSEGNAPGFQSRGQITVVSNEITMFGFKFSLSNINFNWSSRWALTSYSLQQ